MKLLLLGICVLSIQQIASSENCLDYNKFLQECEGGKDVKIAETRSDCGAYLTCKDKKLSRHECDGGLIFLNGVCSDSDDECPEACPTKYNIFDLELCAVKLGSFTGGNSADKCKSYFKCGVKIVKKIECGKDENGKQKYFKKISCDGTKDDNDCVVKK